MSGDIVARLRQTHRADCKCFGCEAADEIERLRAGGCARNQTTTQFCAEAEQLRAERDEARKSVCCSALPLDYKHWKAEDVDAALRLIAAQQGWDCFKGNT